MKLEQTFEVHAPADRVWSMMTDLASVAPCLPGAQLTDHGEDGTYQGTFTVKLGPTTASYRGRIQFRERDDAGRRAVMHASGQDKRGQGGATATMITTVSESGGTSSVKVDTDLLITGKLARFGRGGMIEDVSNRLLADFARCLQAKLCQPAPASAIPAAAAAIPATAALTADAPASPAASDAPDATASPDILDAPDATASPDTPEAPDAPAATAGPETPVASASPSLAPPSGAPAAPETPGPSQVPPAANPVSGGGLMVSVLKGQLRRNGPVIGAAVAAAVLAVGWRVRRRAR